MKNNTIIFLKSAKNAMALMGHHRGAFSEKNGI